MPIKAMLFDIDGTLADSNDLHVDTWEEVFRAKGIVVPREGIHPQIGKGADLLVPALVPGANQKTAKTLGDAHAAVFKTQYLQKVKPFPRVHELLHAVHDAGVRIVLASSASKEELKHYVDLFDASSMVDAQTSIEDVETSKPAPDIFKVALQRAGVARDQALAVGDSPYDVESAGKSGIATIALRSGGFSDEVLLAAGAAQLFDDAADLLDNLQQILAA
jgi:HAD superfamily hydrolase (TIGR01509 family)